jgi:hypothetical protein
VLHRQIVNTFRGNEMNVDPINALQNAKSLKIYIITWKQALYYFYRVSMESYLREDLFKSTIEQTAGFAALLEAGQNRPANVSESGADHDDDDHDHKALQGAWEKEIDDWMLKFSSALIQQHLQFRAFDSPLISFLAARAYNARFSEFLLRLSLPHTNYYNGPITQRVNV